MAWAVNTGWGRAAVRCSGSTVLALLACLLAGSSASAHHPVGLPQYRDRDGTMVLIYNVLTVDYLVRLEVTPGRPVADPASAVRLAVEIEPKVPGRTFEGPTWLSLAEDLGERGERPLGSPELVSRSPAARRTSREHVFAEPGNYVVRLEYTESMGPEVLRFPVRVERSGDAERSRRLRLGLGALGLLAAAALARLAAARRRRRGAAAGPGEAR